MAYASSSVSLDMRKNDILHILLHQYAGFTFALLVCVGENMFLDFRHGSDAEGRHLAFYRDMSVAVFFNRPSTKKIFGLILVDMVTLALLNSIF